MNASRRVLVAVSAGLLVLAAFAPPAIAQEHATPAAQEDAAGQAHGAAQEHAAADDHGAAGDHAEGESHAAVPTTLQYVQKWINFGLLLVVLYWLLVVPPAFVKENFEFEGLKVILRERGRAIVAARDLAGEQMILAKEGLESSAARLERVEEEAGELLTQAKQDAERDKQRLIEKAQAQAELIRSGASRDMQAEVARAERDLQSHIAHLAVGIATGLVKKNFSDADQERLVRTYLDRLGESVS